MDLPQRGDMKADRQCWECLKRRLVCDHTLPHCKKCQKTGKDCPGYAKQKPLQWIQPGRVRSRRSKKETTTTTYVSPALKDLASDKLSDIPLTQSPASGGKTSDPPADHRSLPFRSEKEDPANWQSISSAKELGRSLCMTRSQHGTFGSEVISTSITDVDHLQVNWDAKGKEIIVKDSHEEATHVLNYEQQFSKRSERILAFKHSERLPINDLLSNETSEVVQAIQYYNTRIHPGAKVLEEFAPNPALMIFPIDALHALPPTMHHAIVCLSLNHFICTLPIGANKTTIFSNKAKTYHHRGAAIRSLSHYISQDKTRCSDTTIASILMFMSVELSSPVLSDWRSHARAMKRVVDMRGGFKSLLEQAPFLAPTLVIYFLIVTVANTCSLSSDQMQVSASSKNIMADLTEFHSFIFPYTICPPEMFNALISINDLRAKAFVAMQTLGDMDPGHVLQAHDLLDLIKSFRPKDWAQPGPLHEEWLVIGTMYQAAVVVYCILSLQSLTVLPNTHEMNMIRYSHADRLLNSLQKGIKSKRIAKSSMWPLVVAGVEAAYRGEGSQNWIDATLGDLSRSMGIVSAVKARAVLRRYWKKGTPGWEECFDRPETVLVACGM